MGVESPDSFVRMILIRVCALSIDWLTVYKGLNDRHNLPPAQIS